MSLLWMVHRTSKPHFAVLGQIKGTDYFKNITRFEGDVILQENLLIVRFDAQLYFANSAYFKKELYRHICTKGECLKGVILNAEAINYIDSTASNMLKKVIVELHEKGISFFIAGAIGPTRDIIFSSGIADLIKRENLFAKTSETVAFFNDPEIKEALGDKIAYQNTCK